MASHTIVYDQRGKGVGMDFKGSDAELSQTIDTVSSGAPVVVVPGGTLSSGVTTGGWDVRAYASYYLRVFATSVVAATAFNTVQVALRWRAFIAGETLYQDFAEWYADSASGAFAFTAGSFLELQDTMHGPVMEFVITNNGVDNLNISYNFIGTNRQLAGPDFRQSGSVGGVIAKKNGSLAAATTTTLPASFAYGPCMVKMTSGVSAAALVMSIGFGTSIVIGANEISYTVASGVMDIRTLAFPKRSALIQLNNPGAGPVTYAFFVVQQLSPT